MLLLVKDKLVQVVMAGADEREGGGVLDKDAMAAFPRARTSSALSVTYVPPSLHFLVLSYPIFALILGSNPN